MESILEAIGNTPLIRLRRCAPENGAELWLKLELNPSGSMKDRMTLAMIEGAERDGLISPGRRHGLQVHERQPIRSLAEDHEPDRDHCNARDKEDRCRVYGRRPR